MNVCYAIMAANRDEEGLRALDEELGMVTSPEEIAMEMLRRHQEEQGMMFADPDAPVEGFRKDAAGNLIPYVPDEEDEEIEGKVLGDG